MTTRDLVFNLLFDWLKQETGLVVIKTNQKGPRPPRPYVSLEFLNPSNRLGSVMDEQIITDTKLVRTQGERKAVASINIFGENAIDTLSRVRDSLDRPDIVQLFGQANVAHLDDSGVGDLTDLQETIYEERGHLDLTVSYVACSEVDVSTIESATIGGTANGKPTPPIVVETEGDEP